MSPASNGATSTGCQSPSCSSSAAAINPDVAPRRALRNLYAVALNASCRTSVTTQQSTIIARLALAVGVLVTIAAMVLAGGSAAALLSGFTIWALLPYALLLASSRLAGTRGRVLTVCIVSVVASAFAVAAYADALFIDSSSTGALVFLFVPLYQAIAVAILLATLFFSRGTREPDRPT